MSQKNLKRYQQLERDIRAARGLPAPTNLTATPKEPKKDVWLRSSASVPITTSMFPMPRQPIVLYTPKAWAKIDYMVRQAKGEVGWIGLVDKTPRDNYLITDVFLPKQKVNSTNTIIDDYDRQRIMFELNSQGRYNDNLLYWGHSHVNMDCSPSARDEETVQDIIDMMDDSGGVYIRGIYNKRRESKVDVYIKTGPGRGFIHQCVENYVQHTLPEDEQNALSADFRNNISDIPPPPRAATLPAVVEGVGRNGKFVRMLPNGRGSQAEQEILEELESGASLIDDPEMDEIITSDKLNDSFYVED